MPSWFIRASSPNELVQELLKLPPEAHDATIFSGYFVVGDYGHVMIEFRK